MEISKRVDKFIREHTRNCSNEFEPQKAPPSVYNPWLTPDQARRAVEIAREELLSNVCSFLDGYSFIPTYVIKQLKQAMKDE